MKTALLLREESSDQGTFGRIFVGEQNWFTGELPWRDNLRGRSCIPVGTYPVNFIFAPLWRGGRWVYLVDGTAPRAGILIHSANYMGNVDLGFRSHLEGCIALGEKKGWLDGQKAILSSVPAVRQFESALGRQTFMLEIRDA